jgi:hypothetical protein
MQATLPSNSFSFYVNHPTQKVITRTEVAISIIALSALAAVATMYMLEWPVEFPDYALCIAGGAALLVLVISGIHFLVCLSEFNKKRKSAAKPPRIDLPNPTPSVPSKSPPSSFKQPTPQSTPKTTPQATPQPTPQATPKSTPHATPTATPRLSEEESLEEEICYFGDQESKDDSVDLDQSGLIQIEKSDDSENIESSSDGEEGDVASASFEGSLEIDYTQWGENPAYIGEVKSHVDARLKLFSEENESYPFLYYMLVDQLYAIYREDSNDPLMVRPEGDGWSLFKEDGKRFRHSEEYFSELTARPEFSGDISSHEEGVNYMKQELSDFQERREVLYLVKRRLYICRKDPAHSDQLQMFEIKKDPVEKWSLYDESNSWIAQMEPKLVQSRAKNLFKSASFAGSNFKN